MVGLVERNGMFWVEDLPLSAGTSSIELTATDAAGNVKTTNFTVVQSSVTLTIDYTPSGSDLYKPTGYVAGTVSDPDYDVTVNGVAAVVDEYGNWSAENVPNYGLGTSTFDVVATAPGNPAVTVSGTKEQPAEVLITQHQSGWSISSPGVSHTWTKAYQSRFEPDELGRMKPKFSGLAKHHVQTETGWYTDTYRWSDTNPDGTLEQTGTGGSSGPIPIPTADRWIQSVPEASQDHYEWDYTGHRWKYVHQYFAKGVKHVFPNGDGTETVVVASAKTSETLFTGGKAGSKKKNLFSLAVAATEYKGRPQGAPWYYTPGQPAGAGNGAGKVEVMGKAVGNDNRLYAVLPDNVQQDVTVNIKDAKHFSAGVGATKHKLRIIINGSCALEEDKVVDCAKFSVGQKLSFTPMWTPSVPGIASKVVQWTFGGNYVNDSWQRSYEIINPQGPPTIVYYGSVNYFKNPDRLTEESTYAWWTSGEYEPFATYQARIGKHLTFENGQQIIVVAKGLFDMHRPQCRLGQVKEARFFVTDVHWSGKIYLQIGRLDASEQMDFDVEVRSLRFGDTAITQICDLNYSNPSGQVSGGLDAREYYAEGTVPSTGLWYGLNLHDRPGAWDHPPNRVQGSFTDYVRFRPRTGNPSENIYVTLGIVQNGNGCSWDINGVATETAGVYTINPEVVNEPSSVDSGQAFPEWSEVFQPE